MKWAIGSFVLTPLILTQSSLQSNWNASPGANCKGTNARFPAISLASCFLAPLAGEGCHPVAGTGIAQNNEVSVQLLDGATLFAMPAGLPGTASSSMSPRSRSACLGFYAVGKLAQQPYSPGICELCSWTSRHGVRSPGSACRRANASVELHSIMPRLSLLGTSAYYFAGRGYTWVKI